MNARMMLAMVASSAALLLTACFGGGSSTSSVANPVNGTLGGTAAVGTPIVSGTVKVVCAGGNPVGATTTNSLGAWQVTLAGQGLPCAVQVSGGSINGVANSVPYHSIAVALGTVNITPLTDLIVANLAGASTPSSWFAALSTVSAPLAALGQPQVDAALAKMRAALTALPPLATVNPITTSFTPAPGNVSDDMLAALQSAMQATGIPYATLLNSAAAAAFTAPASALSSAMTTAYGATVSGTPALTVAATPTGVSASATGTTQINLNWSNVAGAVSYNIYRSSAPSVQLVAANKINPIGSLLTAGPFSNTGLTAGTTYYYRVTAVNSAGESVGSAEVSATTATVAPPPTVIGFLPVTGVPGTNVTISGTNFSSFTPAPLVKFGSTTASSTLVSGQSVQATVPAGLAVGNAVITIANGDGTGAVTVGTFAVTATPTAPSAPSNVAAAASSASQISVSWTAVTGATGYNIYRSTSASVQTIAGNKITATPVSASPFSDSALAASTRYYYKVTAINATGEGVASAEVSASTSAASTGGTAGSAIGSGLYTAVLPADNIAFLALLKTACANNTVTSDVGMYTGCTQQAMAAFATNLTANLYVGGLPHQTGGNIVSGPSSYAPGTAKVSFNQGMSGVGANDSCTVGIAEPYIPIVSVQTKGVNYYAAGVSFNFRGTADDTITVTGAGVVVEYTMTNGQGGKIEVHPNLTLFDPKISGTEAIVGTVVNGGWTNYFQCN